MKPFDRVKKITGKCLFVFDHGLGDFLHYLPVHNEFIKQTGVNVYLARQRIKGKPFVCTEYQHPSPNYYGAEGPLLLAAYAGLQDWDGIWLFDYGQGNPVVTMGYVRGFFEIGQHPTKMANLLAAANLFRRGDVRPAQHEWTMALTPEREQDLLVNTTPWQHF